MKRDGPTALRRANMAVLAVLCLAALPTYAGADRTQPTQFFAFEKFNCSAALKNVKYAPGTPEDVTKPAAGTADLELKLFGKQIIQQTISFKNLLIGADGKPAGIELALKDDAKFEDILLGCDFTAVKGTTLTFTLANKTLNFVGNAILTLPFRSEAGDPVSLTSDGVSLNGNLPELEFGIKNARLTGSAVQNGVSLLGFTLKGTAADVKAKFGGSGDPTWEVTMPTASLATSLTAALTQENKPLTLTVTNLKVNQDGQLTFAETKLDAGKIVKLASPADFELAVKDGSLKVTSGAIEKFGLVCDLKLPSLIKNKDGGPVVIPGITVDVQKGLVLNVRPEENKPLDVYFSSLALHTKGFTIDLSTAASPADARDDVKSDASWTGLYLKSATLDLPPAFGGTPQQPTTVSVTDFYVDSQGITGKCAVQSNSIPAVLGFKLNQVSGEIEFLRNRIIGCNVAGTVQIPEMGALGIGVGVSPEGFVTVDVKPGSPLTIPSLGLKCDLTRGRVEMQPNGVGKLMVTGTLSFPGIEALKSAAIGVQDLGVDSQGKIYLPAGGWLTLPKPAVIDLKVCALEARQIGFTAPNGSLTSVILTGGVNLGGGLPLTGGVDFEGLTISKDANGDGLPEVKVGDITVRAAVPGVWRATGTLKRGDKGDFKDCFFGGANLTLESFGAGVDVKLLIASNAWFVGGGVSGLNIPIPPPSPSSAPVFTIYGFHGGIGGNVMVKPGRGRVNDIEDLSLRAGTLMAQVGLLMGSPDGFAWWGESTLTIGGGAIDLSGKATFVQTTRPFYADANWWNTQDRTASLFLNWNFGTKTFLAGGQFDVYLPTRQAKLVEAHGQLELKLAPSEKYLWIGWPPKQSPVTVTLGGIAGKLGNVSARGGMGIDFQRRNAGTFLKINADFMDGKIKGLLDGQVNLDFNPPLSGNGTLHISGDVNFGIGPRVHGEGNLACAFNQPKGTNRMQLTGNVRGWIETPVPEVKMVFKKQGSRNCIPTDSGHGGCFEGQILPPFVKRKKTHKIEWGIWVPETTIKHVQISKTLPFGLTLP